jgi:hypothetical protein
MRSLTMHVDRESDSDPWEQVAEHEEPLEMVIEEELPFAPYARRLLEALEEEGYR